MFADMHKEVLADILIGVWNWGEAVDIYWESFARVQVGI